MIHIDIIKCSFQYACYVTGLVQGTEKITKNKTHRIPTLMEFIFLVEGSRQQTIN